MNDRPSGYRSPARILHWAIAAAVLPTIPAGLIMMREGLGRGLQDVLFIFHKNVGVLLIPLILIRVIYRLRHPPPPLPASIPRWQARIAEVTHVALYLLLIVMPVSGFVRVRAGDFPIEMLDRLGAGPWLAKSDALAAASALHLGGAVLLMGLVGAAYRCSAAPRADFARDGVWARIWPLRAPK